MSYSWGVGRDPAPPSPLPAAVLPVASTAGRSSVHMREASGAIAVEQPVNLELRRLAAELAPMVDVWQRLLDQHLPDLAGRCRTCTKGGTGLPSRPWPCSIHGIAEMARRRHDSDRAS
ncbi:hypothetical protein WEH80_16955 [Actinomycetes bacterium KLBMP 9759]